MISGRDSSGGEEGVTAFGEDTVEGGDDVALNNEVGDAIVEIRVTSRFGMLKKGSNMKKIALYSF